MSNLRWQQLGSKPSPGLFRVATRVHVEEAGPGWTTQDGSNPASGQPAPLQGSQGSYARYDVNTAPGGVLRCVRLVATSRTIACQAPLFTGFPRQEYWSGLPLPLAGDLPDPGIEPSISCVLCIAGGFFTPEPPESTLHQTLLHFSLVPVTASQRSLVNSAAGHIWGSRQNSLCQMGTENAWEFM